MPLQLAEEGFLYPPYRILNASGARALAGTETNGVFIDFTDNSMIVRDTVTPANDYGGQPFSKLTFSRASTATYYNAAGTLVTAGSNVARIGYGPGGGSTPRGYLTEPAGTNLALYSEDLTNAAWTATRASVSGNATTAPDGTTTADKLVDDSTAASSHNVAQTVSVTTGQKYTWSVYAKEGEHDGIRLHIAATQFTSVKYVEYSLTDGSFISVSGTPNAYGIESIGNGWYRIYITATATGTGNNLFYFYTMEAGTATYDGDGSSGIYLWGAQLEATAFATSYITTTSATATRAADVCTMATTLFNSSASVGTLYTKVGAIVTTSQQQIVSLSNGTVNNRFELYTAANANGVVSGAGVTRMNETVAYSGSPKIAAAFAENDGRAYCNGAGSPGDTTITVPIDIAPTVFTIGTNGAGGQAFTGHIAQIMYLPRRMIDADMASLTT